MTNSTEHPVAWRKAGGCGNTTCVEVAKVGDEFWLRDSKNPGVGPLRFTPAEWAAFVEGVASGEFSY
ncbi:hypothetical protein Asp14428_42670 [Actinoplanes sp. NBRC 14428]|uniref:Uncharacterized protein DUF397 n=1 Tax=Pseudosporangium ferrugineum TaxID=439699 RepID=A0A2T0S7S6_9ACTN|nr:DUF397 domain-containing protein [Pseudosporangium ferrugineum]PRY29466.1 uncharacterized protein DUF397 [Pseudosporangium ferrugineum]BCJ52792.1 hypothetical protein Asp14428_42670 [Actinoplanes sp. NBRC 14428]